MRAYVASVLCLCFGLFAVPFPPTLYLLKHAREWIADPNLATGTLLAAPIGVVVGIIAACAVRRLFSVRGVVAALLALVAGVIVAMAASGATYVALPIYPASNIQGPVWIIHPGLYVGLVSATIAAVSIGQLAGPRKRDFRERIA